MTLAQPEDIPSLAAELAKDPDSQVLRERALEATLVEGDDTSSKLRLDSILWFIANDPRNRRCRTPFMFVEPYETVAYQTVKAAWLRALDESPDDVDILRGAGFLFARESPAAGKRLLSRASELAPRDASIEVDLGLISETPEERFRHFSRANELGTSHENVPVWMALAAVEAFEPSAVALAQALLDRAEREASAIGPAASWQESGRELWAKARDACSSNAEAQTLSSTISRIAYYRHWGHTLVGLLALRRGDSAGGLAHLEALRVLPHDFRLRAYGPAPHLVVELCRLGHSAAVRSFLRDWKDRSPHQLVEEWIDDIDQDRVPSDEKAG